MDTTTIKTRYLLEEYEVHCLVGRVLTILDSMGLQERQAKAVKDLVKQEIYKIYDYPFWISNELLNEVRENGPSCNRPTLKPLEPRLGDQG